MSTPAGENKRARREEARAKAAKLQADAAAAERRRRTVFVAIGLVFVLAIAMVIGMLVRSHSKTTDGSSAPFGAQGVIPVPAPAGSKAPSAKAVTVRTAFDYMCPICNEFEQQTDAWQQAQVKAGNIKREFIPVSILDRSSNGTNYSTRAASAAYAVATADVSKVHDFTQAMYAQQPAEGSDGLTNDQILGIAKKVIPNNSTMDGAITSAKYSGYVTSVTNQASKDGLNGTPTVWVNGKQLTFTNNSTMLSQLQAAVAAAAK